MVESKTLPEGTIRLPADTARRFVQAALEAEAVPSASASLVADVLVSADLRGIRSHGMARVTYFLMRIKNGGINRSPDMRLLTGTPTTAVLHADDAIGIVAADRAMNEAIAMAERCGSGFVSVADTSHFGYAGYWAARAMAAGCIGISMASSGRRVAPTFGAESILGTNPMSVAVPGSGRSDDFFLDMSTATVAVGKIETALREDRAIPRGWVAEAGETPTLDDNGVLTYASPLLPLGGEEDVTGGHKGFGLSLMVELLCSALGGSPLSERIAGADGSARPAMGQFMGAIKLGGFGEATDIGDTMANTMDTIRGSAKAPDHDRIFIHGEPEAIAEEENLKLGIPVTPPVLTQLRRWNQHYDLGFELS